jgi:Ca-activated chloride channel family protein
MNGIEYQNFYLGLLGIVGFLFWLINFFHLLKKVQIFIPTKYRIGKFSFGRVIAFTTGFVGWLYLSYAMMGPRLPMGLDRNTIEVNDIFIVVDLSRSMLAEDLTPNRFEVAKEKVHEFVDLIKQDRVGVVIFAEKVFTLLPLTTDYKLAARMIDNIRLGALGDGTNIGDALALAVGRLIQSQANKKVILLLTDGVSNVGAMTPIQAAEMARENKIKIHTVGIGGDKEAKIPVGGSAFGIQRYQMIPGGSVDVKTMKEVSQMTGGRSYLVQNNQALENVLVEINKLERTKIEHSSQIIYKELYYKYLVIAVLLLLSSEFFRRVVVREGE